MTESEQPGPAAYAFREALEHAIQQGDEEFALELLVEHGRLLTDGEGAGPITIADAVETEAHRHGGPVAVRWYETMQAYINGALKQHEADNEPALAHDQSTLQQSYVRASEEILRLQNRERWADAPR